MTIDYRCAGDPDNPLLLMLHGIGGGCEAFGPQLDYFSNDFHAVAWNMPGYGRSTPLKPLSFAGLARALAGLMDELDAPRAHILGHSIGGMVAQQFAADFPDRLLSLVLVATSPAFGGRDGDFQQRFIRERLGPLDEGIRMPQLAHSIVDSLVGPDADPEMLEVAYRCMARVPESSYRANMELLVTFDLRSELGNISVPALLVAGENDNNAPARVMEKMASFIPGARFVCLEKAGHLINLEQPAAFNSVVGGFLKSLENSPNRQNQTR